VSLPGDEGTVRGFSGVSLLVIDEAARVADPLYFAVRPMLAVSQGRLVALDTPSRLKQTHMRGQVLEISASNPEQALRLLKAAQQRRQIPLAEVALYGAQIHAVVPDAHVYKELVRGLLTAENIQVRSLEWIAPTLEDVFISSVTAPTAAG